MTDKTTLFDAAKYLDTPEEIAAFLDEALAIGDPAFFAEALGVAARAKGMTKIAKDAGLSREALYRALSEDGDPRLSTLFGVMRALGVRLATATPLEARAPREINPLGFLKGRVQVPDDFDGMHEGEIERLFEGEE
ncbi:MAG: addiction module antidote protein [Roseiarcus sp.]|jgi:probable addiction module antidote protein